MNDFLFYFIAFIFLPKIAMAVDFSNKFAIMIFASFVFITLLITYFASKKIIAKVTILQQVKNFRVFRMD